MALVAPVGWNERGVVGGGLASSEAEIRSRGADPSSEVEIGTRGAGPSSEAEIGSRAVGTLERGEDWMCGRKPSLDGSVRLMAVAGLGTCVRFIPCQPVGVWV
jgi:hypothetical protein